MVCNNCVITAVISENVSAEARMVQLLRKFVTEFTPETTVWTTWSSPQNSHLRQTFFSEGMPPPALQITCHDLTQGKPTETMHAVPMG